MGEHGVPVMGEHGVPWMGEHGVHGMGKHGEHIAEQNGVPTCNNTEYYDGTTRSSMMEQHGVT